MTRTGHEADQAAGARRQFACRTRIAGAQRHAQTPKHRNTATTDQNNTINSSINNNISAITSASQSNAPGKCAAALIDIEFDAVERWNDSTVEQNLTK